MWQTAFEPARNAKIAYWMALWGHQKAWGGARLCPDVVRQITEYDNFRQMAGM